MARNMSTDDLNYEVEPEKKVREDGEIVVKADNEETQATDVRPMRYVLGIGLSLVIVGMAVAYLAT